MSKVSPWRPLFGPDSWRVANGDKFPSDESLRHHLRNHAEFYIQNGAVVRLRGRFYATDRMDTAVVEVASIEAKRLRRIV